MISLHPLALFGLLEALIVVLLVAGVMLFKWRGERHTAETLRQELHQARSEVKREVVERKVEVAAPQRDYADFLREQLETSSVLLGQDPQLQPEPGQQDDPDVPARQMLAARHQFLQLEMDVQGLAAGRDVEAQRRSVIEGMQALLAGLTVSAQDAAPAVEADEQEAVAEEPLEAPAPTLRKEEDKLRDQINYLRSVIGNQHDVMRELRLLLEEHGGDSEELQEALRKLGDAEAQGIELERCLEVMEQENQRLKQMSSQGGANVMNNPDADMLRDLVGSQQRTIGKLQNMLKSLAPDSGKANELADAINKIQRANNELNSCVMVLEDENTMLRGQVETLQVRIADLEAHAMPDAAEAPADAAAVLDEVVDAIPDVDQIAAEPVDTSAERDVDALLDAAQSREPPTEPFAAAAMDVPDSERTAATEVGPDDIDALLDASQVVDTPPETDGGIAAETDRIKPAAEGPEQTGNESGQDDIDTLLADLFAEDNTAGNASKS